jgi:hypothetical protein
MLVFVQVAHVEEIGGFLRSGSEGLLSASRAVVEVGSGSGFPWQYDASGQNGSLQAKQQRLVGENSLQAEQ